MTKYKLYYFDVTGVAEPIRFLLHFCEVEFEDIRFKNFQDWEDNYKKDMPMEQVPVLEIDGCQYHQHKSICRYIAKKFQLYGSNEEEAFKIDAFMDDIEDLRILVASYYKENNETYKVILKNNALEKIPFFLNKFEARIKEYDCFLLNKISVADIYFSGIIEVLCNIMEQDLIQNYPKLKKIYSSIRCEKKIKKYLDQRPKTLL